MLSWAHDIISLLFKFGHFSCNSSFRKLSQRYGEYLVFFSITVPRLWDRKVIEESTSDFLKGIEMKICFLSQGLEYLILIESLPLLHFILCFLFYFFKHKVTEVLKWLDFWERKECLSPSYDAAWKGQHLRMACSFQKSLQKLHLFFLVTFQNEAM